MVGAIWVVNVSLVKRHWGVGFDPHRPYQTNLLSATCNRTF
jgi:hypothetical protein